jgi:putative hydrolase of the HAD superfamily
MTVGVLFFDVGGVILTNGWDRTSRRAVIHGFDLDWEEYQDRHEFVSEAFETGRLTIDAYLDRTVFYRDRQFSRAEFIAAMKAQSAALPGMLDLLADLRSTGLLMATLNNESAELNEHRIDAFDLRAYFDLFLSSAWLGVKKPDKAMYQLALRITMRPPADCVFIDDRELNLQCAGLEGMHTIHHRDADQLRAELRGFGVDV